MKENAFEPTIICALFRYPTERLPFTWRFLVNPFRTIEFCSLGRYQRTALNSSGSQCADFSRVLDRESVRVLPSIDAETFRILTHATVPTGSGENITFFVKVGEIETACALSCIVHNCFDVNSIPITANKFGSTTC